jgi:hypothetical protein
MVEQVPAHGDGAEHRAGDEPEAEGGADEAHRAGALGALVTSATAAVATERLPLKAPVTMRERRKSQNEPLHTHTR